MIFRALLGLYLAVHFAALAPWAAEVFSCAGVLPHGPVPLYDAPWFMTALAAAGAALGVLLALGRHDRLASGALWLLLAFLHLRNPLIANPSLPFVGWLLLAHAYKGRRTPDLYAAAWVVMAVAYTYSGWMKLASPSWVDGTALAAVLANPLARPLPWPALPALPLRLMTWFALGLELFFAPLALFKRARPALWLVMTLMHLGLLLVVDFADLTGGMLLLHLYTFDPAWLPSLPARRKEIIAYDKDCGVCALFVGMAKDFRLVALEPGAETMLVVDEEGRLLRKSAAARHVMRRIGGAWRLLAAAPWPDAAYDLFARNRRTVSRLLGVQACRL